MFAAFLMFASTTMLMRARHFFPYDLALLLGLIGLWVALSPSDRSIESIGTGILAGAAFSTYFGDWLRGAVVLGAHVLWRPMTFGQRFRRAALSASGCIALPIVLAVVSGRRNRPLLPAARGFAARVTHGEFAEGWSLPGRSSGMPRAPCC